ncbi:MAG: hypothetical protein ABMA02_06220, partial [Saprospiraceae bacterium]
MVTNSVSKNSMKQAYCPFLRFQVDLGIQLRLQIYAPAFFQSVTLFFTFSTEAGMVNTFVYEVLETFSPEENEAFRAFLD